MALTLKRTTAPIPEGPEHYEVLSGDRVVGLIHEPAQPGGFRPKGPPIWYWSLSMLGRTSAPRVAPTLERAKEQVRAAWEEWLLGAHLAETDPPPERQFDDDAVAADVDATLAEFGGDARKAISALLHDLGVLAEDAQTVVSKGYVRGVQFTAAKRTKRQASGDR